MSLYSVDGCNEAFHVQDTVLLPPPIFRKLFILDKKEVKGLPHFKNLEQTGANWRLQQIWFDCVRGRIANYLRIEG